MSGAIAEWQTSWRGSLAVCSSRPHFTLWTILGAPRQRTWRPLVFSRLGEQLGLPVRKMGRGVAPMVAHLNALTLGFLTDFEVRKLCSDEACRRTSKYVAFLRVRKRVCHEVHACLYAVTLTSALPKVCAAQGACF